MIRLLFLGAPRRAKIRPLAACSLATLALAAGACGGETGVIQLSLVTAPDSTVLDDVVTARLTLSVPLREVEATRDADGKFRLAIDVPADGPSSTVTFEGLDAAGGRVAFGCTGVLPIAAIDAAVAIYVAAPGSVAAAPVALDRPRADSGTADFPFGVLIAGGRSADGAASAAVDVYDVYSHRLQRGADLPAARRAPTVAAGVAGFAYVFGGADAAGAPTGTLWRFDTTVAPAGEHLALADEPSLARAGARVAAIRPEAFVVTGAPPAPPVVIDGLTASVTAVPGGQTLTGTATSVTVGQGASARQLVVVAGEGTGTSGLALVTAAGIDDEVAPPGTARTGHGAAAGADDVVTLVGGGLDDALATTVVQLELATRTYREAPSPLETPRRDPAVARVGRHLIVAGGTGADGAVVGTVEVLDASTLTHVATLPMVAPRTGATAHALSSGHVLIVGGVDGSGAPVATFEIFTPDPDAAFPAGPTSCGR